jgi:hypothetical protein
VAGTLIDPVNHIRQHVVAEHAVTGAGRLDRQGKTYVAQPDDSGQGRPGIDARKQVGSRDVAIHSHCSVVQRSTGGR